MSVLLHQRCFNHETREAAARCTACRRFYCLECVTEYDRRMMCASCVAQLKLADPVAPKSSVLWTLGSLVGLLGAWLLFYYIGMGLARIPSDFHGVLR
jgi:hypothetical protein